MSLLYYYMTRNSMVNRSLTSVFNNWNACSECHIIFAWSVKFINPNLGGLFRDSFWGERGKGRCKIITSLLFTTISRFDSAILSPGLTQLYYLQVWLSYTCITLWHGVICLAQFYYSVLLLCCFVSLVKFSYLS